MVYCITLLGPCLAWLAVVIVSLIVRMSIKMLRLSCWPLCPFDLLPEIFTFTMELFKRFAVSLLALVLLIVPISHGRVAKDLASQKHPKLEQRDQVAACEAVLVALKASAFCSTFGNIHDITTTISSTGKSDSTTVTVPAPPCITTLSTSTSTTTLLTTLAAQTTSVTSTLTSGIVYFTVSY